MKAHIVHEPLAHALALGGVAARAGFDWPGIDGVLDKVAEETQELRDAIAADDRAHAASELGDLLFALTSVARHLGVDPAAALDGASARFEARYAAMCAALEREGLSCGDLPLDELDVRWQTAKRKLRESGE